MNIPIKSKKKTRKYEMHTLERKVNSGIKLMLKLIHYK